MSEEHVVREIDIEKVRDSLTFRESDQIEREAGFGISNLMTNRQTLYSMYLVRIGYQRAGDKISVEALMDSCLDDYMVTDVEEVEPDPTEASD